MQETSRVDETKHRNLSGAGGFLIKVGILAVAMFVVALGINALMNARDQGLAEVSSLMANYKTDGFSFDNSRYNGSDMGNYTLNITEGGVIHSCKNISMDTMRQHKPISCEGGITVSPK